MQDPITGRPFKPAYNIPTSFAEAVSYETQLREILRLLEDNYWQWAKKQEITDAVENLKKMIAEGDETTRQRLQAQIDKLHELVLQLTSQSQDYDPTQGVFTNSRRAMNNMYRELAIYGARANQMAQLTCQQAAEWDCLTWAVIGNWVIFGYRQPRATGVQPESKATVSQLTVSDLADGITQAKYFKQGAN